MIVNVKDVLKGHARFLAEMDREVQRALDHGGQHAEDHVQRHAAFKRRTGELQDATRAKVVPRGSAGWRLRISNKTRYAAPIEYGAKPHIIRPRRAKVLRFMLRGKVVFARKVNHPGNRPYKFLYRAWHATNRVLEDDLTKSFRGLAKRF